MSEGVVEGFGLSLRLSLRTCEGGAALVVSLSPPSEDCDRKSYAFPHRVCLPFL